MDTFLMPQTEKQNQFVIMQLLVEEGWTGNTLSRLLKLLCTILAINQVCVCD